MSRSNNKKGPDNEKGFIAIVALGIFALLSIFGLMVQAAVINTVESVKNTNNYYAARDIADSVIENLQFALKEHEAGFNQSAYCAYGDAAANNENANTNEGSNNGFFSGPNSQSNEEQSAAILCDTVLAPLMQSNEVQSGEIRVELKGRSYDNTHENSDKFENTCLDQFRFPDGCYIVPFPGEGTAGENCSFYNQNLNASENRDLLNNPCNWNKLVFGSNLTDRVSIPLYYDEGTDEIEIVNPFENQDSQFWLRIRTPCLPCGDEEECEENDESCERYLLDDNNGSNRKEDSSIVAQWQISGKCGEEECALSPYTDPENDVESSDFSAISEYQINRLNNLLFYNKLLDKYNKAVDAGTNQSEEFSINTKINSMEKPILTIFLNSALISSEQANIPYLEYQLVTNQPVTNSKTKIYVKVNINGNIFEKTLYKEEQKGLIDFAIQN